MVAYRRSITFTIRYFYSARRSGNGRTPRTDSKYENKKRIKKKKNTEKTIRNPTRQPVDAGEYDASVRCPGAPVIRFFFFLRNSAFESEK